uniref:GATA zinc finger domain-containing protein 14-like n=1 Tax=Diabrotica virgifera virgifera TaxID=50390 RepID=A0A6P7HAB6_DIAVI
MRTKNPPDLNSALGILTNDFQISLDQNNSSQSKNHKSYQNNNYSSRPKSNFRQNQQNNYQPQIQYQPQTQYQPRNQFPIQRNTMDPPNPQPNPQNMRQNNQNNYFQNNPSTSRNFNRNSNVFQPNPNRKFSNPTPMTITTNNTFRPSQNFQNRTRFRNPNNFASQNIIPEELHNIDNTDCPESSSKEPFLEEIASEENQSI